jgi:hypothetical protein
MSAPRSRYPQHQRPADYVSTLTIPESRPTGQKSRYRTRIAARPTLRAPAEAHMADDESLTAYKLSEADGRNLAKLADVPEKSLEQFCDLLEVEIQIAHLGTAYAGEKLIRASDVSHSLNKVEAAARGLDKALRALLVEDDNRPSAALAGSCLEIALDGAAGDVTASGARLAAYRHWLETLIVAVEVAKRRATVLYPSKVGRPTGAGGNPFFDNFVNHLHEIAGMTGGKWTHYRDRNSIDELKWKGTLMPALDILRPYLPANKFFPAADVGRSVENLISRLKIDTTDISSSAR